MEKDTTQSSESKRQNSKGLIYVNIMKQLFMSRLDSNHARSSRCCVDFKTVVSRVRVVVWCRGVVPSDPHSSPLRHETTPAYTDMGYVRSAQ